MNREFLKELGLEDETINKVMAEYGKSIQELKPAKEQLEAIQSERDSFENQLKEMQQTLSSKESELGNIEELKKEIEKQKLENLKTSIAIQANIPIELAGRLSGVTEDEIRADAEQMAEFVNRKQTLPLKHTEPPVDDKNEGLKQMLTELTKN